MEHDRKLNQNWKDFFLVFQARDVIFVKSCRPNLSGLNKSVISNRLPKRDLFQSTVNRLVVFGPNKQHYFSENCKAT